MSLYYSLISYGIIGINCYYLIVDIKGCRDVYIGLLKIEMDLINMWFIYEIVIGGLGNILIYIR